jgi:hypothetical protein
MCFRCATSGWRGGFALCVWSPCSAQAPCLAQSPDRDTGLALCVWSPCFAQAPHRGMAPELAAPGSASKGTPLSAAPVSRRPVAICAMPSSSLSLPHRGTGLPLYGRPSVRASASAALTQALPKDVQRLGPARISSAARARPPQVACDRCPGTAPELAAPSSAMNGALAGAVAGATRLGICSKLLSAPPCAQRPRHAPCAISAAPSERRRPGQRVAPRGCCPLAEAAVPGASEGSEGSPKRSAGPRMHEPRAQTWGAAKPSLPQSAAENA